MKYKEVRELLSHIKTLRHHAMSAKGPKDTMEIARLSGIIYKLQNRLKEWRGKLWG